MRHSIHCWPILVGLAASPGWGQDCAPAGHHDIDFVVQNGKIVTGIAILLLALVVTRYTLIGLKRHVVMN